MVALPYKWVRYHSRPAETYMSTGPGLFSRMLDT
jgi:hypothetical protein